MTMTVETTAYGKLLHVLAAGEFNLDEATQTFLVMVDSIKEHHCDKVLFDGRAITGEPSIIDRFYYGEFAAHAIIHRNQASPLVNPKFAYVLHPPVLDPGRLGETVAVNRGLNVKAFDNLDKAIEWLELVPEELENLGI